MTDAVAAVRPSFVQSTLTVAGLRITRARAEALAWGIGLGALSGLMIAIYPSFSSDLAAVVETLPKRMREAFGIDSYDTARSFLDGEMYSLLVPFAVSLFAIRHITHDLSRHEERSWLDVELAAPLGRAPTIVGCYLAAVCDTAIVAVLAGGGALLAALIAGVDLPVGAVASGTFAVWLLACGFAAVALALSAASHRSGIVLGGASAALVAMYVIDLAGTLVDGLKPIRVVSPFEYYGTPVAENISVVDAGLMTLMSVLLTGLAVILFERHDVRG